MLFLVRNNSYGKSEKYVEIEVYLRDEQRDQTYRQTDEPKS